ncbi:MAG: multiheme c-type cytochrome [Verrucomicrobiota bacterium]
MTGILLMWLANGLCAAESCIDCHTASSPALVRAWKHSAHAARNVGCADCHGSNHSRIFEVKGEVSAAVCAACHSKQAKEFNASLHAIAMETMRADGRFGALSKAMADQTCASCHQIGATFLDGSRGKCNSCHSGHSFSAAEARRPEACAQCHTGPDHPQIEMWQASKHGQLFASAETRDQSPTCVTCHMHAGNHNTSLGLAFGHVANGAVLDGSKPPVRMRSMAAAEVETQRAVMIKTCLPCHSSRFATESLEKADAVKQEADALLAQAAEIIARLRNEGLLRNERKSARPATAKENENEVDQTGLRNGIAEPDFDRASPIEQRFFNMVKFHHASTFKGAYHNSPVHTHTHGFVRLKQDLNFITNEAAQIRALELSGNE